jgi:hypothetical protein
MKSLMLNKADKRQIKGRAFLFRGANMVITKYFKEGSFQTKGAFLCTKTFECSVKLKLSQSEKNLRVIEMKIVDHLSEDQLKKLNHNKKNQPEVNKKKAVHENVDWEEIMGMNRDTYRRKGGAIRRR